MNNNPLSGIFPLPSGRPILANLIKRGLQLRTKINPKNISASELQLKTLQSLLLHAEGTAFGHHYEFAKILASSRPMRLYRDIVPIHDYDKIFNEWLHRSLAQEPDVTWTGKIKYFALSSGTSGSPSKHIPVTEEMLYAMRRASTEMFINSANIAEIDPIIYTKKIVMLGSTTDLKDKGDYMVGDLSGINGGRIPAWFRRYYKPGARISNMRDYHSRITEIAKEAPNWDVGVISGIPAWIQLMLERVIAYNNAETIHDIWPNLTLYVTGGVAFEPYRKGFNKLCKKPLVYLDTYLASEGFVSFQTNTKSNSMELVLGNGIYYEFIPFNDENFTPEGNPKPDAVALTIDEVEEGVDYAILLSTCAGLWRYLIGDTIKFTNIEHCEIIITGRTKHFLSITGEHLSIDNMNHGLQKMEEELDVQIREFTVCGIEYESLFAHKWYVGSDSTADNKVFAKKLDAYLCEINDDYATERRENALKEVFVEIIPAQWFYEYQATQGKLGGQSKFPRVMKKDKFAEFEAFVNVKKNG